MGQQRVAAVQHMGNGVFLVFPQGDGRVHAAENDVAAVIFAGAGGVHFLVILAHQRLSPLRVAPNPVLERLPDGLLLLGGQGGLLGVQHPALLAVRIFNSIVDTHIPQVEGIFEDFIGVGAAGPVGGIGRHIPLSHSVFAGDLPFRRKGGVVDFNAALKIKGRVEGLVHELLDVLLVNPRCPQPHLDLGSVQVFGLGGSQGLHVDRKGRVLLRRPLGLAQLPAHVAGQVLVRRDVLGPLALRHRAGQAENHVPQFGGQFLAGFAGELFHVGHVHAGFFRNGDRQGLAGRVHGGDGLVRAYGPLGEHIRLAFQPAILVQHFQRAEQVIAAVIGKGQPVRPVVDKTIFSGEIVIAAVQFGHLFPDVGIRRGGVHLQVDEPLHTIPQPHQPFDAGLSGGVQVGAHHAAVFPEVHRAVHHRVGVILHVGVSREGFVDVLALAQLRQCGLLVGAANVLHGIVQLIGQLQPFDGGHGVILFAVLGAFGGRAAQHHLRVIQKILVDREAFLGPAGLGPVRGDVQRTVPLLQKQDVGYHIGPGVGAESVVGQTDRPQQLGPLGQIPAYGGILCVHCVAAGDKSHHAARPHLVQRLGKEVVVDVEAQLVVGFVVHLILAERDVTDGKVIEVPPVSGLEARYGDVGFGIKLFGNPAADGIQFHAVQTAPGHALRQHPEEVAHAHRRLQNVAGTEAHLLHSLINGADNGGAGVVGIEGGGPGRFVFLRGQQLLQLRILGGPRGFVRVKGIRHAAPAHIAGQHFLLCRRSLPGGFLQVFQQLDRRHIGLVLGLGAALAQMIVGDAEVFGVAAQVVPVLLIGRLLGCPLVGESLPLAVDRDRNRVVRLFLRLRVRRWFGRRGFRPVNVQPFHHHVIGQMVLFARIDGHRIGMERLGLGGRFLNGLGGFNRFFDSGISGNSRFGLLPPKAVQLTGIQPAQQGRDLIPAEEQHGQPLLLRVQHFQFDAFGRGAVVGGVASLQLHRFHDAWEGPAQPLGDLAVGLAGVQQLGKLRLVRRADQAVDQHVPEVLVSRVGVYRQKFVDCFVAGVRTQQRLEPLPALDPVDGVRHIGG